MKINKKKRAFRTKLFFTLILFFLAVSKTHAEDAFVNGAKILSKGERAFSFDLGLDLPEPLFYGLRLDWGIADKYQIGFVGSFLGVGGSFGLDNKLNFWKNKKGHHFLAFQFSPSYAGFFTTNSHELLFPFLLVYEGRPKKSFGIFLKAGSLSNYSFFEDGGAYDLSGGNRHWHHFFKMGGGLEFPISPRAAVVLEGGIISRFDFDNTFPFGKIGFTNLIGQKK